MRMGRSNEYDYMNDDRVHGCGNEKDGGLVNKKGHMLAQSTHNDPVLGKLKTIDLNDDRSYTSFDQELKVSKQEIYDKTAANRRTYVLLGLLFLAVAALAGIGSMIIIKRDNIKIVIAESITDATYQAQERALMLSENPSVSPSLATSEMPSLFPTHQPTISKVPSTNPSESPTKSMSPSNLPSITPTITTIPSQTPTLMPSVKPSTHPTTRLPTAIPTPKPSHVPTQNPTPTQHSKYDIDVLCWDRGDNGICPCGDEDMNSNGIYQGSNHCTVVPVFDPESFPQKGAVFEHCDLETRSIHISPCKTLAPSRICLTRTPRTDLFYDEAFQMDPYYFLDYDCAYCIGQNEICNDCSPGARCLSFYEQYWPQGVNCTESPDDCSRCLHPDSSYKCKVYE